jgi:hypothetical protein
MDTTSLRLFLDVDVVFLVIGIKSLEIIQIEETRKLIG